MNLRATNSEQSQGLNENPPIPDTTGIGSVLTNKNHTVPTITIGNIIVNSESGRAQQGSVREELDKARKDISL